MTGVTMLIVVLGAAPGFETLLAPVPALHPPTELSFPRVFNERATAAELKALVFEASKLGPRLRAFAEPDARLQVSGKLKLSSGGWALLAHVTTGGGAESYLLTFDATGAPLDGVKVAQRFEGEDEARQLANAPEGCQHVRSQLSNGLELKTVTPHSELNNVGILLPCQTETTETKTLGPDGLFGPATQTFEDEHSHELLVFSGMRVLYRRGPAKAAIELTIVGRERATWRVAFPKKPQELYVLERVDDRVHCKNPDGSEQTFVQR